MIVRIPTSLMSAKPTTIDVAAATKPNASGNNKRVMINVDNSRVVNSEAWDASVHAPALKALS